MTMLVINIFAISIYIGGAWAFTESGKPLLAAMAWPVRLGFVLGGIAAKSYDAIPGKTDAG